ncbi:hypothetical protein [Amycolatopsis samaneae]|uniref:Uncharacterized protein n=1 Tax=Amycolatopsis samaneae TaxID=664691 RepID=A0ABW5GCI9_9PSEU
MSAGDFGHVAVMSTKDTEPRITFDAMGPARVKSGGRGVLKDAFGALDALKASFSAPNALKASFSTTR